MTRHPCRGQWDPALRRQFSENVERCRTTEPLRWMPDTWERCTLFLTTLMSSQPERIAALDTNDIITIMEHGSAEAKEAAMAALQHVRAG